VAITEIVRFARIPVLTAPFLSLATNRMVQNGRAPASRVKYASTSLMLNHKPYSGFEVALPIIS